MERRKPSDPNFSSNASFSREPMTTNDLETLGMSSEEVDRVVSLRDEYNPMIEQCESQKEYEQICFLKWRYEHGLIEGDDPINHTTNSYHNKEAGLQEYPFPQED